MIAPRLQVRLLRLAPEPVDMEIVRAEFAQKVVHIRVELLSALLAEDAVRSDVAILFLIIIFVVNVCIFCPLLAAPTRSLAPLAIMPIPQRGLIL